MKKSNSNLCNLLPWYINGTLDEQQMQIMNEHIDTCSECASDFRISVQISRSMQSPPRGAEELHAHQQFGFTQLQRKISQGQSDSALDKLIRGIRDFGASLWHSHQRAFSACGGGALVLLVVLLLPDTVTSPEKDSFTLLSNQSETTYPSIQVVFGEGTTEKQVRDFLATHDLELIGNPSPSGVYRMKLTAAEHTDRQLAEVLALPHVIWASLE